MIDILVVMFHCLAEMIDCQIIWQHKHTSAHHNDECYNYHFRCTCQTKERSDFNE